jgi:hypothetical protein
VTVPDAATPSVGGIDVRSDDCLQKAYFSVEQIMAFDIQKMVKYGILAGKGERGVFGSLKRGGQFPSDRGSVACVDVSPVEGARAPVASGSEAECVGSPSDS